MFYVNFLGETCAVEHGYYDNGRHALRLLCKDGSPMATATVNIPDVMLADGAVLIKDWGENEGMYEALANARVIEHERRPYLVETGHAYAKVAWLSIGFLNWIGK